MLHLVALDVVKILLLMQSKISFELVCEHVLFLAWTEFLEEETWLLVGKAAHNVACSSCDITEEGSSETLGFFLFLLYS